MLTPSDETIARLHDRASLPLHVQMLMALRLEVRNRQRAHEAKCGKGLPDQDYQRHVGRIAECEAQVLAINEMMKADLDQVADRLEENTRDYESAKRTKTGHRRGQRRADTTAD